MDDEIKYTEEDVRRLASTCETRADFAKYHGKAYLVARNMGILKMLFRRGGKWSSNDAVWDESANYSSRSEFCRGCNGAYMAAKRRGLLAEMFPIAPRNDWSNDLMVLFEASKYPSRRSFSMAAPGAYRAATKRGLLQMIDFPDKTKRERNAWAKKSANNP